MCIQKFLSPFILLLTLASACAPAPTTPSISNPPISNPPTSTLPITTTPIPLFGRWLGGYHRADGTPVSLLIHVDSDAQGTVTIEPQIQARTPATFSAHDNTVQLTLAGNPADGFTTLQFSAQLANERLVGTVTEDATRYDVTLYKWIEAPPLKQYTGLYTFPSGRALSLLPPGGFTFRNLNFFAGDLTYTDFETGALRGLYIIAPDTFLVGGARSAGFPFSARITFDRNGSTEVAGLIWQTLDPHGQLVGEAEQGTRHTLRVERVTFTSPDGTPLAGQLTLPNSVGPNADGPHPAFVMLHGSERGRRNGFGQNLMSAFMASRGIALLSYDKRGVGDSGGTYRESADTNNLKLLAQDAAAGVAYLETRADIDSAHLGLIGGSQAGWIIPLAAQTSGADLFIILSGPVVSVGHEDLYSAFANDGEAPPRYTPAEISAQLAVFPPSGFDPVPVLATLTQPGLWLWGDQDQSVPIPESAANLQTLLDNGQTNFAYVIFPNADHSLQQSPHGLLVEMPYSSGFTAQHYPTLTQWLSQHIP